MALGRNGIAPGARSLASKNIPPSWKLADLTITAGLRGILFPPLRHVGGTNLVIFPANLVDGDHVRFTIPITGCRTTSHPGPE